MVVVIAAVAALALVAGAPMLHVGAGLLAVTNPVLFLAAAGGWAAWTRVRPTTPHAAEADVLRLLAAELRSGSSLPVAIASAGNRFPDLGLEHAVRLARSGARDDVFGAAVAERLPGSGRLLGRAIALGVRTGAPLAALFDRLARHADQRADLDRELRVGTAQARLSAVVVGCGPLVFSFVLVLGGVVDPPWGTGPPVALLTTVGVTLQLAGLAIVWLLIRRHVS